MNIKHMEKIIKQMPADMLNEYLNYKCLQIARTKKILEDYEQRKKEKD